MKYKKVFYHNDDDILSDDTFDYELEYDKDMFIIHIYLIRENKIHDCLDSIKIPVQDIKENPIFDIYYSTIKIYNGSKTEEPLYEIYISYFLDQKKIMPVIMNGFKAASKIKMTQEQLNSFARLRLEV